MNLSGSSFTKTKIENTASDDQIWPEKLKVHQNQRVHWLTRVCQVVKKLGKTPKGWQTSVIISLLFLEGSKSSSCRLSCHTSQSTNTGCILLRWSLIPTTTSSHSLSIKNLLKKPFLRHSVNTFLKARFIEFPTKLNQNLSNQKKSFHSNAQSGPANNQQMPFSGWGDGCFAHKMPFLGHIIKNVLTTIL